MEIGSVTMVVGMALYVHLNESKAERCWMIEVVLDIGVSPLCSITTRFWYQKLGKVYRALLIKKSEWRDIIGKCSKRLRQLSFKDDRPWAENWEQTGRLIKLVFDNHPTQT